MKITKIEREFKFKEKSLEDPNPKMTVDQIRNFYAAEFPELINAVWEEKSSAGKMSIEFKTSVGKKG